MATFNLADYRYVRRESSLSGPPILAGRSFVGQSRISTRFEKPTDSRLGGDIYKKNGSARSLQFMTDLCLIR